MNKQDMNVLSKTEYGIYFDYMNNPGSIAYNIPFFLKLRKNFKYSNPLGFNRIIHI